MSLYEEIEKAYAGHGVWKLRLKQAIDSDHSDCTVEDIGVDDLCDFGRWLYALPPEIQRDGHWQAVRDLHAAFHVEAAQVLEMALRGRKQDAVRAMLPGRGFQQASEKLAIAMRKWKDSVE